jgi:tRNA U34 2-thiouridine synthase MnmA/TrmU
MQAIVIFSGGLDSSLAVRFLQEQSIECLLVNFVTQFHDRSNFAVQQATALNAPIEVYRTDNSYLKIIANPHWGYGKAVNPCIDCRIMMCRVAKEMMVKHNADFVATGEVVGQRPNSQMLHQLELIERESQLDGHLLRPLCAKHLPPTDAEKSGLINRDKLGGFSGRGRTSLINLARKLGIKTIPQPSTGCLLCEKSYAPRLRDLFRYEPNPITWDTEVLSNGRQLRLNERLKAVVARNEQQCLRLQDLFNRPNKRPSLMLVPNNFSGTTVMIIGNDLTQPENITIAKQIATALLLRFTRPDKYNLESSTVVIHYGETKSIEPVTITSVGQYEDVS